ncbi:MAG TPA: hypothetical protein VN829_13905 [Dongiaceae bacterium]|nr:hypothetical protein [Dongiaceae bacterium]
MIGNLTNDITRLCGEIAALRDSRAALRSNLAQGREDLADSNSRTKAELRDSRQAMAERTRSELRSFVAAVKETVTELKQGVAAFQGEFVGDLAGARRAWCGHHSMSLGSHMSAGEQPREFAPKAKKRKH